MGAIVEGNGQRNRIREVRKSKRMTAQALADAVAARGRIGMHLSNLTKLETHQRKLTDVALAEIAAVLEVDPSELLVVGEVPTLTGVPLLPWHALMSTAYGSISDESLVEDRIAVFATSPKTVAVKVPKAPNPMIEPGAIAVVDLNDREVGSGWWIGVAGRELTLLHRDDTGWTDALREGNPGVKENAVQPLGRVLEYRVPLVGSDADAEEDDIYVEVDAEEEDARADPEPDHMPNWGRKKR